MKVGREVDVAAAPEAVFAHFVDPSTLRPRSVPGGRFRLEIEPGEYCEGEYVVEPPQWVLVAWGWTNGFAEVGPGRRRVDVVLEAAPTGTRVSFTHVDLPTADARRLHDEGSSHFLGRLVQVCDN